MRLKLSGLMVFLLSLGFMACEKEAVIEDIESYVDNSIFVMERDANAGRFGCFEFVFPLTILFPDDTSAEVESYADLKETIRAWKEANPDVDGRPHLSYPLEVITADGELLTIESKEELRVLRRMCKKDHPPRPGRACFRLVFPVEVAFPDGTIEEAGSKLELKQLIRQWKHNNPTTDQRPSLVFPIMVEYRDGTVVTVESKEELQALKEECRG